MRFGMNGVQRSLRRLGGYWQSAKLWVILITALAGVTAAISAPLTQGQEAFGLQEGDVAPQDILAPYPLSYSSEVLTQEARDAAAEAVARVYDPPDSQVTRAQLDRLGTTLEFIDAVRADPHATPDQKIRDLQSLSDVRLDPTTARALLDLSEDRWKAVKDEALLVLEQVMRTEIRPDRLEQARRTVPALVSIGMPEDQGRLVTQLVSAFVAPNSRLNEPATEAAREGARETVSPVIKSFAAGETIISRGRVVEPEDIEALEAYGLLTAPDPWKEVAVRGLLVAVLGLCVALYAYRTHPEKSQSVRLTGTLAILFVLFTLGMSFMIPGRTVLPYVYPAATLPILSAVLFGPGMGIITAVLSGALAGYLAPRGLEIALYMALSGSLGALMIGQAERLSSFFWAGLAGALGAVAMVVVFRFPDPGTDALGKATLIGASLLSGVLSASLGFGSLLLIGSLLGITTNLQLIELSRPDHPLSQMILRNAPGTYQHSLQVANLAEQAARAVGANPLLTRVGALYHDAGKALRPQFFIENQIPGQNIHEQLDPATSASVIVSHVEDGLELARKYRLPTPVRNFIPEHHGRLEVSFQYKAAIDAAGGDASQVDRKHFTYPGPRPRSKETALLMLADGVEARARAEMPKTEEELDQLVRWVIQDRLTAGELDRTDLTLRDLDTIRRSFVNTLKAIYHPRIRYPDATGEEIQPAEAEQADVAPQTTASARADTP